MAHRVTMGSLAVMQERQIPDLPTAWHLFRSVEPDGGFQGFAAWFHEEYDSLIPVAYDEDEVIDFAETVLGSGASHSLLDAVYQDWEPEIVDGPAGC